MWVEDGKLGKYPGQCKGIRGKFNFNFWYMKPEVRIIQRRLLGIKYPLSGYPYIFKNIKIYYKEKNLCVNLFNYGKTLCH